MYNYNSYNQLNPQYNPYTNNTYINELQQMRDRIDKQIQQNQQQVQSQVQQPIPQINQNFQLAPQLNNDSEIESRYAENIDEVKNTFVMKTAIFSTRDFSTIWVKDVSGNIRIFNTEEVIELDNKDIQIQNLQKELEEMKLLMAKSMQSNASTQNFKDEQEIKPKATKNK